MEKLKINWDNALTLSALPKKYVDLINEPLVQQYLALAEKYKADVVLFITERFKKIELINAVINEANGSLDQLSQDINKTIQVGKKIQLLEADTDLKQRIESEILYLNKSLWMEFFKSINLAIYIQQGDEIAKLSYSDFNQNSLLECLKLIDEILSVEHTAYIYEKFVPYLDYRVLKTGDVVLSLNPSVNGKDGNKWLMSDEQRFVLKNDNFHWLVYFILAHYQGFKFSIDRLDTDQNKIYQIESFKKYGLELSYVAVSEKYRLKISKEHLPFLEQQIGFQVKN